MFPSKSSWRCEEKTASGLIPLARLSGLKYTPCGSSPITAMVLGTSILKDILMYKSIEAVRSQDGYIWLSGTSEVSMAPQQPTPSDFPSHINASIIPPPSGQTPVNILLLLHGLGDTNTSFTNLARQLSLPETACISIQAPTPLPFDLGGFHWGDDITFDSSQATMDYDTGFSKSSNIISEDIITNILVQKCCYKPRNILLFGFGQGAMAAIAAAISLESELGGIVSIGGPLPEGLRNDSGAVVKNDTPLIVLGGSSGTLITQSALTLMKQRFRTVEYIKWPRQGDGMPGNRDEMLPIMRFFARRLQSMAGVPEGSVDIP